MNKIISKGLLYCHGGGGGGGGCLEMDMVEEGIVYFHHTQGYQRLYIDLYTSGAAIVLLAQKKKYISITIGFYENPLYNISIKTLI